MALMCIIDVTITIISVLLYASNINNFTHDFGSELFNL